MKGYRLFVYAGLALLLFLFLTAQEDDCNGDGQETAQPTTSGRDEPQLTSAEAIGIVKNFYGGCMDSELGPLDNVGSGYAGNDKWIVRVYIAYDPGPNDYHLEWTVHDKTHEVIPVLDVFNTIEKKLRECQRGP